MMAVAIQCLMEKVAGVMPDIVCSCALTVVGTGGTRPGVINVGAGQSDSPSPVAAEQQRSHPIVPRIPLGLVVRHVLCIGLHGSEARLQSRVYSHV